MPPRTMRWWSRSRGIDPEPYETWRASLTAVPGRAPRILAWTVTAEGGLVVLGTTVLSVLGPPGPPDQDARQHRWQHLGWHEIERGGWNAETGQLRWQTYEGRRGTAALPDPARVPAVFKERVDASIVFERFVPLTEGSDRGVVVSGRRDLASGGSQICWHSTVTRGVTWRTPGARELANAALAAARYEYDDH